MTRLPVIWLIGLALLAPAPASAQQGLGFQTDPDAPLSLAAQEMRWQQTQGIGDLRGNVRVTQGPMRMRAQAMQIRFADDGVAETLTARGHVELTNADGQSASSERAEFDIRKNQLVLRGAVRMQAHRPGGQNQKLVGETLSIDMESGRARLRGGKTRARIELER